MEKNKTLGLFNSTPNRVLLQNDCVLTKIVKKIILAGEKQEVRALYIHDATLYSATLDLFDRP